MFWSMNSPLCSRGCGRPANPGRKWCETCFRLSSPAPLPYQCSTGCGRPANPGFSWCQQCYFDTQNAQNSEPSWTFESLYSSASSWLGGFFSEEAPPLVTPTRVSALPPPLPQNYLKSPSPCLLCPQPPHPNCAFCLSCWPQGTINYSFICQSFDCALEVYPGHQRCHQHLLPRTDIPQIIQFYEKHQPYYQFTNFFQAPMTINHQEWPTAEAFFQAMKFHYLTVHQLISVCQPTELSIIEAEWCQPHMARGHDTSASSWCSPRHASLASHFHPSMPVSEIVRRLPGPRDAFNFARKWQRFIRQDWHGIKLSVMHFALFVKFSSPQLRNLLSSTSAILVEHTRNDNYWADGGDGTGENWLGKLLMLVRGFLINSEGHALNPYPDPLFSSPHYL